uniref:Uncharacterized protein n=1 Tax=Opuntia streptacantha TaxID=393608 RepID=A0A7C9DME4_OPUST
MLMLEETAILIFPASVLLALSSMFSLLASKTEIVLPAEIGVLHEVLLGIFLEDLPGVNCKGKLILVSGSGPPACLRAVNSLEYFSIAHSLNGFSSFKFEPSISSAETTSQSRVTILAFI